MIRAYLARARARRDARHAYVRQWATRAAEMAAGSPLTAPLVLPVEERTPIADGIDMEMWEREVEG